MRNKVECKMCGTIIYFPNSLKDNPPLLCKACEIASKLAVDFNPLQIAGQYYVRNEDFPTELIDNEVISLLDQEDQSEPKKYRKKKATDFKL